ncbi:MAG: hypothetical protein IJY93_05995 [Clostridia bacterium]|nr:hypothetical protein [Clostridia bacterium]
MNYGIIFQDEESPLIPELSEALRELGFTAGNETALSQNLLDALNRYRAANGLPTLDFCDPVTLKTLGIDADGEEIILLARYGERNAEVELDIFDTCREIVTESRELGITLTQAIYRHGGLGSSDKPSETAINAAVLALLHK